MCSIIDAMAIGAITRIDVTSNLQSWKLGMPTHAAEEIDVTDDGEIVGLF